LIAGADDDPRLKGDYSRLHANLDQTIDPSDLKTGVMTG
jgi:hypothetical protein